jgi:hypothetical protein
MRLGKPCYRCGGKHSATTCHLKDVVCNFCYKKGHIQRVCQSRLRRRNPSSPPVNPTKGQQPRTHKVEEGQESPSSAVDTDDTTTTQQTPPPEPFPVDYNVFVVGTDKKVIWPQLILSTVQLSSWKLTLASPSYQSGHLL